MAYQLKIPCFSNVAGRTLPEGSPVTLLATRESDGAKLAKIKGASWPIAFDPVEWEKFVEQVE